MVDEEMPVIDSDFTDFEIIPRDPETYKDWQVGDKIAACTDDKGGEVIFRSGKLVICKDKNDGRAAGPYTCEELFEDEDFRLVLTDIEKQIIEERKKSEWKPQDGDICFATSNEGYNDVFIFKDTWQKTTYYVSFRYPDEEGTAMFDNSIDVLRPATEEEKQKLFASMAKVGKRWNAEKKVVEDIPKPYEFRKGEPVLVRNDSMPWACRVYVGTVNGFYATTSMGTDRAFYRHCIPYNDKTAHLLGTSDDYEEDK